MTLLYRQTFCFFVGLGAVVVLQLGQAGAQKKVASPETGLVRHTQDGYLKQRPAWSPDGRELVYARHQGAKITLLLQSVGKKTTRRLTKRSEPEYDAVWSPDGKRLAYSYLKQSPNQGDVEVYTVNPDGTKLTPVAVTNGKLSHEESPSWSPDGKRIAFTTTRFGNQELAIIDITGKNLQRVTSDPSIDAHPAWSPDGKKLAFATNRWGDLEIAVVDLQSGTVTRLTHNKGLDDYPAWSPDGQQLAFTSNRVGNFEIFVMQADGSKPRNITRNSAIDNFSSWSKRHGVTFVSNRDSGFDIYSLTGFATKSR